jgi:DNA-binding HxlR family transcriptional regulator
MVLEAGCCRKDAHLCSWPEGEMRKTKGIPKSADLIENPMWDDFGDCGTVLEVLDRIGDKWTVMVVGALSQGPMRFNAIMRIVNGVSHRMLTITLRGLERDGLVKRTAHATIPPKVVYELTESGRSLIEPLKTVAAWAAQNRRTIVAARERFDANRADRSETVGTS